MKIMLLVLLFFNVMHYALRPWPWIIVALASLVVFPDMASIQEAFPNISKDKLGNDLAYPCDVNNATLRFVRFSRSFTCVSLHVYNFNSFEFGDHHTLLMILQTANKSRRKSKGISQHR